MKASVPAALFSAGLALVALAGCGTAEPPPGEPGLPVAPTGQPSIPAGSSPIRFNLSDCQGCQVNLQSAPNGTKEWESGWTNVSPGEQWFIVPTQYLRGMSIQIKSPAVEQQPATTNVVVLYEGTNPGDQVNPGSIADYSKAYGCWSGEAAADKGVGAVSVMVQVVEVGGQTRLLAFTDFGMPGFGTPQSAEGGVLSSTDFFSCTG